jgi:hypothetical protein
MSARLNLIPAILASAVTMLLAAASPALAGDNCHTCKPPPPPCCKPSPPPPCCAGGHQINIPNVNVNVGATVIVNANASAFGVANARANGDVMVFGGGGGSSIGFTQSSGLIGALNVEGAKVIRTPYKATRTRIRIVIIRAVCIDDKLIPHPASQVSPDREIAEGFEGELFRCLAGTRMQYTLTDFDGKVAFGEAARSTAPRARPSTSRPRASSPAGPSARRATVTSARCSAASAPARRSSRSSRSRPTRPTARRPSPRPRPPRRA